ncbi:MAG TPA: bacteriohopanetetrol glucosamine biosynthesis glycosyltransferase HpnI [Casimicrobiaceae bacterium]
MLSVFVPALGITLLVAGTVGIAYALAAVAVLRRFTAKVATTATDFPAITIMKPLHGVEPGLYENLASFCDQDYRGPVQLLFGVPDPADAATVVIEQLIADLPHCDIQLEVTSPVRGANPKVATLVGLQQHIRHEVIVLSDSDIAVGRDYLAKTVAALDRPGVGLVTCLYRGEAHGGLWSRLATMAIDYHFFPSVLVGLTLGLARPCFGSTIALRRGTLAAIGGFEAFLDTLADDNAMGEAVRAAGLRVAIPPFVVIHACSERSASELVQHELRWARTIRLVSPLGYAGSAIMHPLPLALLGAALMGFPAVGVFIIGASIACRLVLQLQVDHTLRVSSSRWWLGPARDLLAFAVYVAGFFVGAVSWRGRRYEVRADGTLVPIGEPRK